MGIIETVEERVRARIARDRLIRIGDQVLVACSGGMDSTVLLDVLCRLSSVLEYDLAAVYIDHGQHNASQRALCFVREHCRRWGISFFARTVESTKSLSGSSEMRLRELRYNILRDLAQNEKFTRVATGHTVCDQVETILMRILRGTSIGGIAGIRGLREDLFIRPLLDCTREQVRAFVRAQRFVCVEDPTNCSQRFLRNRIRLNLLPQIRETVNPAVDQALLRLACVAERDERFIVSLAEKIELSHPDAQTVALPVEVFQSLEESVRARVLLRMLRQVLSPFANLEQKHIEQVLNYLKNPTKQKGKSWSIDLPSGVNAGMEGRFFYVRQGHTINQSFCFEVVPPCEVETPQGRIRLYFRPRQGLDPVRATKKQVFFDFCKLKPPFVIRSLKPGDCIQVWGGGGKHKVSRLLMDARVPKHYRQLVPLLVMDKTVLWVAGFQRSDVAPCCDNCFRVLVAEYIHIPNFFSYIKPQ